MYFPIVISSLFHKKETKTQNNENKTESYSYPFLKKFLET